MVTLDSAVRSRASFGPRRATWTTIGAAEAAGVLDPATRAHFDALDRIYRALCALMFNFVPTSGHPGGSISAGRIVQALMFDTLDLDLGRPDRDDADVLSFAAGHKALGLYALSALRTEIARLGAPSLLPLDPAQQLRLDDLLGFRRNPITPTPRFQRSGAKALDGHPTPATPFVRLATGASGVGLAASLGLAWAAADVYGADAPRVHIVEGEGGLTPGRVSEALAMAATAGLDNVVLHVDWNQASIDSNRVCADEAGPGDYVAWTPMELAHLHDWNVIEVADGLDPAQVLAAQRRAAALANGQPTAIVYRTVKGWRYGIEGRASHGAGHALCSDRFHTAVGELEAAAGAALPRCEPGHERCGKGAAAAIVEDCYAHALDVVRHALVAAPATTAALAARLVASRDRLDAHARAPRPGAPAGLDAICDAARERATRAAISASAAPSLAPGAAVTLRDELARALHAINVVSGGGVVVAAADLLGSTSVAKIADGFPGGFQHRRARPGSRTLAIGGICEDAAAAVMSGIAGFGRHLGVTSSYGAFNAPLGHIASRLHAIGCQAREHATGAPYRPFLLVCAHAGLKTGEDGPTHADPQSLQLLQGNFPDGTLLTLTPWEPQEIAYLLDAALAKRPAVIAPFVTRPPEIVLDRAALGLAPAWHAAQGVYRLHAARGPRAGTVVLQGCGVTYAFVTQALPRLEAEGLHVDAYVVTSAELFDLLPEAEREAIFPASRSAEAIGITDFTLPTLDRWIRSDHGRRHSLHPFRHGRFLGSGPGDRVMEEAGLDGAHQFEAIRRFVRSRS